VGTLVHFRILVRRTENNLATLSPIVSPRRSWHHTEAHLNHAFMLNLHRPITNQVLRTNWFFYSAWGSCMETTIPPGHKQWHNHYNHYTQLFHTLQPATRNVTTTPHITAITYNFFTHFSRPQTKVQPQNKGTTTKQRHNFKLNILF
jgi:hypothetical protein